MEKSVLPSQTDISRECLDEFIQKTSFDLATNNAPQAFACVLPLSYHVECALACARKILCDSGTGSDSCPSCSGWKKDSHPDLFFLGRPDAPPGIEECRRLWGELSLKPVSSNKRIGVLFAAHRLSIPAANSLLKITEETPASGRIMLLMEEDSMLPTLRSRLRIYRSFPVELKEFRESGNGVPLEIPEFLRWVGQTKKARPQELALDLDGWVRYFVSRNDLVRASRLDLVCVLARKGKLTAPMIQDLALAGLEGDVSFEQLFDDFW